MKKIVYSLVFMAVMLVLTAAAPVSAYSERPVAVLSGSPTTICAGQDVRFYGGNSFDPDGQIWQYKYEYGDGSSSQWVIGLDWSYHKYHNPGTFYAKLRVKDNEMYISDYSNVVQVRVLDCDADDHNPQITDISVHPEHPDTNDELRCYATFQDIDNDLSHVKIKWYRNGGVIWDDTKSICDGCDSVNEKLPASITSAGDNVKCEVTVYDYTGRTDRKSKSVNIEYEDEMPVAVLDSDVTDICVGDYVKFSGKDSYDPDDDVKQYYYEFGDGTSSPWITDTDYTYHMYNREGVFYARLKVKDNQYQESEWSNHIRINVNGDCNDHEDYNPVLKWMGITPSSPTNEDDITCRVEVSDQNYDLDRVVFAWSVDGRRVRTETKEAYDGTDTVYDTLPGHYTSYGDRVTCEATVFDERSNTDIESKSVTVEGYEKRTPVAVLTADRTEVCVGERVLLDGRSSYSLDGRSIRYYLFETGDGESSSWTSGSDYSHTYDKEGTFMARLLVKDSEGKVSGYDSLEISVSEDDECRPFTCGVQMMDFDYLASGKTGNKLWARAKAKNTGEDRERITFYLYVGDTLEDQYTTHIDAGNVEEKTFYFRVNDEGREQVRISAYAECGDSDEREGTIDVKKGYTPEPAPVIDPLNVNIYPKNLDMTACEGRTVTIEMKSPERREFEIEVSGMKDEWLEYDNSVIVDGSKKAYLFLNPAESGRYYVQVTVKTGQRVFTQTINVYAAPPDKTNSDTGGGNIISGMFSAGTASWILGLIIIILIVAIALLYKSSKKDEELKRVRSYRSRNNDRRDYLPVRPTHLQPRTESSLPRGRDFGIN